MYISLLFKILASFFSAYFLLKFINIVQYFNVLLTFRDVSFNISAWLFDYALNYCALVITIIVRLKRKCFCHKVMIGWRKKDRSTKFLLLNSSVFKSAVTFRRFRNFNTETSACVKRRNATSLWCWMSKCDSLELSLLGKITALSD